MKATTKQRIECFTSGLYSFLNEVKVFKANQKMGVRPKKVKGGKK
jgi:hypothetical protein